MNKCPNLDWKRHKNIPVKLILRPSGFSREAVNKPIPHNLQNTTTAYLKCKCKCIFHWIPGKDPFRKSVFKYRLREWISIYLKLLYGSIHSSRVATFFTSTCLFSSRGRLFPFISNFSIGSLSEIPWESGIRTRFSFRNLWRKKRKSCRNFCEVHSEVNSSDLVTLYLLAGSGICAFQV